MVITLRSPATSESVRWHTVLVRACFSSIECMPADAADLYQQMTHTLQVMTDVIARGGEDIQLRATDVLLSSLQHDAALLRDFLEQQPEHRLMKLLIELLTRGKDGGVQEQVRVGLEDMLTDPPTRAAPDTTLDFSRQARSQPQGSASSRRQNMLLRAADSRYCMCRSAALWSPSVS